MIIQLEDGRKIEMQNGLGPDQIDEVISHVSTSPSSPMHNAVETNPLAAGMGVVARAMQAIPGIDELGSAIAASSHLLKGDFGAEYGRNQAAQKSLRDETKQQYPGASMAGDVGGILATLPFAPTLRIPVAAKGVLAGAAKGLGEGILNGGIYGGLSGFGEGDNIADRTKNATNNGAIGAASAGLLGALGGGLAGRVASMEGVPLANAGSKVDRISAKQLNKIAGRDNANLSNLGADESLLSNAGRGAINRAESIVTRDNHAADKIANYAQGRKAELPSNLGAMISKSFPEVNYPLTLEKIATQAKTDAAPAYQAAYDMVKSIDDPQIKAAFQRVINAGDKGLLVNQAKKVAAYRGGSVTNISDALSPEKVVSKVQNDPLRSALGFPAKTTEEVIKPPNLSTQDVDNMTRVLRDMGKYTEGAGMFGGKTAVGSARYSAAMNIRARLKEINPAFGKVTSKIADDQAVYDAAMDGKSANLFGSNWKSIISDYNKLPKAAKQGWRIGQAENLHTKINSNPQAALRQFNSPQFQKVMGSFYSPEEMTALTDSLAAKANEMGGYQRILGNSRTQGRAVQQAEDKAMLQDDLRQAIVDAAKSGPWGALKKGAGDFLEKKLLNTPTQQRVDDKLAGILTAKPFQLGNMESVGNASPAIRNALARFGGAKGPLYGSTQEILKNRNAKGILGPSVYQRLLQGAR